MKMDFACPACGAHVQVILPPVDFHDLQPVQAWCRGERGQHKVTRMERITAVDSTTTPKPSAL